MQSFIIAVRNDKCKHKTRDSRVEWRRLIIQKLCGNFKNMISVSGGVTREKRRGEVLKKGRHGHGGKVRGDVCGSSRHFIIV